MTPPKERRFSPAKLAVLRMLGQAECHTASTTYGDSTVSGSIAKMLVDAGLARYTRGWQIGNRNQLTKVAITDAGRDLLRKCEGQ